jgi:hypothetical protein
MPPKKKTLAQLSKELEEKEKEIEATQASHKERVRALERSVKEHKERAWEMERENARVGGTTTTSSSPALGRKRDRSLSPTAKSDSDVDSTESYLAWAPSLSGGMAGAAHYDLLPYDWHKHPPAATIRKVTANLDALSQWIKEDITVAAEHLQNRATLMVGRFEKAGMSPTQDPEAWQWATEAIALALRVKYYPRPMRAIVDTITQKRAAKEDRELYGRAKRRATWNRLLQDVEKRLLQIPEKNTPPPSSPRTTNNTGRGGNQGRGGFRGRGRK